MIHFYKALGLYFNILQKKLQVCKISNIYCNFKLLCKKCAKPKSSRNIINYKFSKSPHHASTNSYMQKYLQNFQKQNFYSRKTETVQILLRGNCAKLLRKNCAICFLLFKAFQRFIKSLNPMTGSRSKAFMQYVWWLRQ